MARSFHEAPCCPLPDVLRMGLHPQICQPGCRVRDLAETQPPGRPRQCRGGQRRGSRELVGRDSAGVNKGRRESTYPQNDRHNSTLHKNSFRRVFRRRARVAVSFSRSRSLFSPPSGMLRPCISPELPFHEASLMAFCSWQLLQSIAFGVYFKALLSTIALKHCSHKASLSAIASNTATLKEIALTLQRIRGLLFHTAMPKAIAFTMHRFAANAIRIAPS